MSRRDELVESLDNVFTTVRTGLGSALQIVNDQANRNGTPQSVSQPLQAVTRSLSNLLDLPSTTSTSTSTSNSNPIASTSTLFPNNDIPPPTRPYYGSHVSTATLRTINISPPSPGGGGGGVTGGDILPEYSRDVPTTAIIPPIPKQIHTFISKTSKMKVEITAMGEGNRIVLIQDPALDGKVWIEGVVTLILPHPETITHLRIRLKGLVTTLVMKIQGSGRSSLTDERQIWEDAVPLWSQEADGNLPHNESPDNKHHQGTFTFPFKLHIPSRVDSVTYPGKMMTLPPSFVLSGEIAPGMRTTADWASCRYFVKATLGRKGLMKTNERLVLPLIYLPTRPDPIGSPLMQLAIASNQPIPGPLADPAGWKGKKMNQIVKRGTFSPKKAKYEVTLLLPNPSTFVRYTHIPFAVKITSTDTTVTTRFEGAITVYLLQRAMVAAQGITCVHDQVVAKSSLQADGPSAGTVLLGGPDKDGIVWGKKLIGKIKLTSAVQSTFSVPSLSLSHYVVCRVSVPGPGNTLEVAVPITIIPSSRTTYPVARPTNSLVNTNVTGSGGAGRGIDRIETPPPAFQLGAGLLSTRSTIEAAGLPPSYFDVMEHER